jgi:PEGA domain
MKRPLRANVGMVVLGFAAPLAACSSMPENFLPSAPSTMAVRLESEPAGAEASTSLGQSCRTPCSVAVAPTGEFAVTFSLNGYQPQTIPVRAQPTLDGLEHEVGPDLMRAHTNRHNRGPTLGANPVYAELRKSVPVRRHASRKTRPTTTASDGEPVSQ